MKLLLISSIYPNKFNPFQGIYIKRIHDIYIELGYEVDLLVYQSGKNKIEKIFEMVKFIRNINRKIKQSGYDLINVQYPFLSAIPFRFKIIKCPIITTVHGSDINYNTSLKRWLGGFTLDLLKKSDAVIVNTEFFKRALLNKVDIPEYKVKRSPAGGYDSNQFHPNSKSSEDNFKITSDHMCWIGFAARLIEKKGWRIVFEAFRRLKQDERYENLGLMIAGDGPDLTKIKSEIKILSDRVSPSHIKLLGNLSGEKLADYYRELDVFVFPTQLEESLGLVGIESLASGTPVIASDIGGIKEYMMEGVNGYLIEPGNVDSLVDALKQFFDLAESDRMIMVKNAAESVSQYEKSQVGIGLDQIIKQVVRSDESV